MERDLLSQRNWILFEQSRSHRLCLSKGDKITKCCVTWTTLVLRLVQTDLYSTMLWRDWAGETLFVWSKVCVSSISKQRAKMQCTRRKYIQCNWCEAKEVLDKPEAQKRPLDSNGILDIGGQTTEKYCRNTLWVWERRKVVFQPVLSRRRCRCVQYVNEKESF